MTDYFNYGFDENLWRLYCQKQKSLRDDNLLHRKINVNRDYYVIYHSFLYLGL